ncbi:MAG: AAA family ATPase [Anaerolineae bacterium]|nr:AAA family ATPase [Anaerolineae bacterium]
MKPLTILVGPNASGKSNVIKALELLRTLVIRGKLPFGDNIKNYLWAGGANTVSFKIDFLVNEMEASYYLELQPKTEEQILREELKVGKVKVISAQKGKGEVRDEDGVNPVSFRSTEPALKSAGDYGNKPVTRTLMDFFQYWGFYDFKPEFMRNRDIGLAREFRGSSDALVYIDADGQVLEDLLIDWHSKYPEAFEAVKKAVKDCTGIAIETTIIGEKGVIQLREGYKNPIPLTKASDGTLRLLAYYILLNEPYLTTLIVMEEPERNLHPAMLKEVGSLLEKLAEITQVIVTIHSSQLLDSFNPDNLADNLAVLLLRNRPGLGTEVINLAEVKKDREALKGWIEDFGIGSAVFDSQLLQDVIEN